MADDPLDEMRAQVDAAYAAADRLVREAEAAARERAGDVPPAGYEGERSEGERSAFGDLQALAGLLDTARSSVPPELARQVAEAARELLEGGTYGFAERSRRGAKLARAAFGR